MKLSTRSTYGLRALVELALAADRSLLSAALIARRQGLSVSYLEQLLHRLKRHRIVTSVRGPRGGYRLARDPSRIVMADVVQALDGVVDRDKRNGPAPSRQAFRSEGYQGRAECRNRQGAGRSRHDGGSFTGTGGVPAAAKAIRAKRSAGTDGVPAGREEQAHAQRTAQAVWRCVHERLMQALADVTLEDVCETVRSLAGDPLDHRYVFHI